MNRVCLSDGSTLEVVGSTPPILEHTSINLSKLVVRRCPHCGEVTFWDDYEEPKDKKQQTLKVTADD